MAGDIATARPGARVLGYGQVDVRKAEDLQAAVDRCVEELGGIDFCMQVSTKSSPTPFILSLLTIERRLT